jgi:hypothetical protein
MRAKGLELLNFPRPIYDDIVEGGDALFRDTFSSLRGPKVKLVNIQNVVDDFEKHLDISEPLLGECLAEVSEARPPFEQTWVEFSPNSEMQVGAFCRFDHDGVRINTWTWRVGALVPLPMFEAYVPIDHDGRPQNPRLKVCDLGQFKDVTSLANVAVLYILNAFEIMSCANTELRPCGKFLRNTPRAPINLIPACVWHEIHVGHPTKRISCGQDAFHHDQSEFRRRHWVRGHPRRLASGVKVWIHAHQRGNAELGEIIPSYIVSDASTKQRAHVQ